MSDKPLLGAQDQGDGASQFNAADFHIQQALGQISTATLVKIIRAPYDKDGKNIDPGAVVPVGYVDVQPMINQLDGRGQPTKHGTVYRLSYHRFQGGKNAIIADPTVGDIGKMVVADRDTSSVRATNDVANPGSRRKFDKADGTFFGSTQQKEPPEQYVTFTSTGVIVRDKNNWKITTNADGIKLEAKGNTIIMGESGVLINGCLINKSGNVITKNHVNLDEHLHDGVMSGSSDTTQPIPE